MERHDRALTILEAFAVRTGLVGERPPRRYLWTDAFAVSTWVGLGRRDRARRLVAQVHAVLGRHRDDDPRAGWISGLDEEEGTAHPTAGGLRIGKPLPERLAGAAPDRREEWDRDGQYFHYLTRWMRALDHLARASGQPVYRRHAQELALAAHRGFVRRDPGGLRMIWKARIDLSTPLVASMGHHDPLEGLLLAVHLGLGESHPEVVADYAAMCAGRDWATDDPLGLGGLLLSASLATELERERALPAVEAEALCASAARSLALLGHRQVPDPWGLPFRELGLAIGLAGVPRLLDAHGERPWSEALRNGHGLAAAIGAHWSKPGAQLAVAWRNHRDINEVMLAASLAPKGALGGSVALVQ